MRWLRRERTPGDALAEALAWAALGGVVSHVATTPRPSLGGALGAAAAGVLPLIAVQARRAALRASEGGAADA